VYTEISSAQKRVHICAFRSFGCPLFLEMSDSVGTAVGQLADTVGMPRLNNMPAKRAGRNASLKERQRGLVKVVVVVDLGDWRERHFGTGLA